VQRGTADSERLARLDDPDARPARPWSLRAGLRPVFLGGFVLLVLLPALVWVALANWQQRVAEQQHLRDVETELAMQRARVEEALQRALMEAEKARAALTAQELTTLNNLAEQSETHSRLKQSDDGEKAKTPLPACPCGTSCRARKR
jgi:cytochrome c-type biogenesis protein CcmH/NrfG